MDMYSKLLMKHMKNYSDDELIDNFNYLVNYAVGIRVRGELNLTEKTLYDFRTRIYQYLIQYPEQKDLIFHQFLNLTRIFIEETNISTDIQRMGSTKFMSNDKKSWKDCSCLRCIIHGSINDNKRKIYQ